MFEAVKAYAQAAKDLVNQKWEEFSAWWSSIELKDLFAPAIEWCNNAITYIKDKWQSFMNWLASLNPFANWGTPNIPAGQVETGKRELAAKHGTLNLSPSYMHAAGGIFSQPHIGLVAEAGREAIIPLENKARGIPLWQAAGEEMGVSFSNTQPSREISVSFSPNVSITVNGGEPDSEQKFRRILSDMFEDLFAEFQGKMQRLAFE